MNFIKLYYSKSIELNTQNTKLKSKKGNNGIPSSQILKNYRLELAVSLPPLIHKANFKISQNNQIISTFHLLHSQGNLIKKAPNWILLD